MEPLGRASQYWVGSIPKSPNMKNRPHPRITIPTRQAFRSIGALRTIGQRTLLLIGEILHDFIYRISTHAPGIMVIWVMQDLCYHSYPPPEPWEDPQNRTPPPNSGLQDSYGVDYRTLRWIHFLDKSIEVYIYVYICIYMSVFQSISHIYPRPKVDLLFGILRGFWA